MPDAVLLGLHYFPSLEYFTALVERKIEVIYIDIHEHYEKQTYRNRCQILTTNGVHTLSIPIVHSLHKIPLKDVKIDYAENWVNVHWRTIQSAYGKAPFFIHYADEIQTILYRKYTFLVDLNLAILKLCLNHLKIITPISLSEKYMTKRDCPDYRSLIHPKKSFEDNHIYFPFSYIQLFTSTFVPNLSILDLLFCEGNNAGIIIRKSC